MRLAASRDFSRPALAYVRNFLRRARQQWQLHVTAAIRPEADHVGQFRPDPRMVFRRPVGRSRSTRSTRTSTTSSIRHASRQSPATASPRRFIMRGPANYHGTARSRASSSPTSQTFDFLPGLLSGFGLSANYTYMTARACRTPSSTADADQTSPVPPGNLPLEQLSKHNINVAVFYEKGPLDPRRLQLAVEVPATASDVIFPYFSIFNAATGQLDASPFCTSRRTEGRRPGGEPDQRGHQDPAAVYARRCWRRVPTS